ncbi:MAG: nuclease-related domain-containing protein [Lysinibacillus sp.]
MATSRKIKLLQSAMRRGFPEMEQDLQKMLAGQAGEQQVRWHWRDMHLAMEHVLFHDFTIQLYGFSYQMDALFVSRHFILVVEVKNIVGEISFCDSRHQFVRQREDGVVEGFRNPLDQVRRHVRALGQLIGPSIPIEYAVVFSNVKSVLKDVPGHEPVFHASGLETYVNRLFSRHDLCLRREEFDELVQRLKMLRHENLFHLALERKRIINGVLCAACAYKQKMMYRHGKFFCTLCGHSSKTALFEALEDYYLLVGEWMTNEEFRHYTGVQSADAAKRLLQSLHVAYEGEKKAGATESPTYLKIRR